MIVYAQVQEVVELKPSAPRLHQLQRLLSQRLYRGAADENAVRGAVYTREQLSSLVQCSEAELSAGISKLGAFLFDGHLRLLDRAFQDRALDLLLSYAQENGWPLDALPLTELVQAASQDLEPSVGKHVVLLHGSLLPGGQRVVLDPQKLARFRGTMLLRSKPQWLLSEFEAAWHVSLPGDYCGKPVISLLYGHCIIEEKGSASSIRYFVMDPPPATAEEAFGLLFTARAVWPLDQMLPYITPLATPSLSVDQMLLRHCFVNRVETKVVTVSKR